jgi:hypothetical protein
VRERLALTSELAAEVMQLRDTVEHMDRVIVAAKRWAEAMKDGSDDGVSEEELLDQVKKYTALVYPDQRDLTALMRAELERKDAGLVQLDEHRAWADGEIARLRSVIRKYEEANPELLAPWPGGSESGDPVCYFCGQVLTDGDTEIALCNACEEARARR